MKLKRYGYLFSALTVLMGGLVQPSWALPSSSSSTSRVKTVELGKKPEELGWSGSIRTGVSRNQDEYSDAFSATSLSLSRALESNRSFSVATSYNQPVSTDQDKVRRYGVGDLDLGINYDNLYRFSEAGQLSGSLGLTLPTSRASRYASMQAAISGGLASSWQLPHHFNLTTGHELTLYSYKYDTADMDGNAYNSPYGISNSLGLGWTFKQFRLNAGGSVYYTRNYAGTENYVQSLSGSGSYSFNKSISTSLGWSWRDQILTNNSLFDDDTTVTSVSVSYIF